MWSKKKMKYVEKERDYFFILDLFSTWTYIPQLEQRLCPEKFLWELWFKEVWFHIEIILMRNFSWQTIIIVGHRESTAREKVNS